MHEYYIVRGMGVHQSILTPISRYADIPISLYKGMYISQCPNFLISQDNWMRGYWDIGILGYGDLYAHHDTLAYWDIRISGMER